MLAASALALTATDVAFFVPPNRPQRPARRSRGGAGVARTLIRNLRRELARATAESALDRLPQPSRNYPY
jgi:hypothetical protein